VLLNGSIVVYGLYLSRGVKSSADWFLAGRSLPWWLVGLSMYATAIDASDLIADSGGTYTLGMRYFVTNWVGIVLGWALAAFVIIPPMYRAAMYTNAEYLEARFGPAVRVLCALIQVQYRTLVLAIIATTLYLTLSIVCGWGDSAWWMVVGIAVLATVYTSLGGLRTVAVTDALQFGVMTLAGLVIWLMVWQQVGGWSGVEQRLTQHDSRLAAELLHAGHEHVERLDARGLSATELEHKQWFGWQYDAQHSELSRTTPAWLVAVAFVIVGLAYSIVNHTQSMRLFAARSEWDLKMSVSVAGAAMLVMTFFNLSMGVMGRALMPEQSLLPDGRQDAIFPFLVSGFDVVGLKGLVVAGVLAASLSTYDSIGSTLSALLTRDVYARFIVTNADDGHYLRVGRWFTLLVVAGSFCYVPFLEGGMLLFYIELTSTFVVPLLTLYLMGTLTRVHRSSGLIGLLAGAVYGTLRLLAEPIARATDVVVLPDVMTNSYAAYIFSMLITAGTMCAVSLVRGWEARGGILRHQQSGWLESSRAAIQQIGSAAPDHGHSWPLIGAGLAVATGVWLSFVVFW
jgi:SSS family solute:Na+ symporter